MRTNLYWVETGVSGRLAIMARPRAGDWLDDEMRGVREAGVHIVVSLLTIEEVRELELEGEEKACVAAGLAFRSLPITDRGVPSLDAGTIAFVRGLRDALVEGNTVVVHCRMGIGRSSLIAASALRLLGIDPGQAFSQLSVARGLPVPDTEEQRQWVMDLPA